MTVQSDLQGNAKSGRPFLTYLVPYRGRLLLGVVLLLLTNALDKSIPWLLKEAVDALAEGRLQGVAEAAGLVVLVAANMWWVRSLSRVTIFNVGRDVEFEMRNEFVGSLHALGASFYSRFATGDIMSRATNDLGQVRLLAGFGTLNVVNAVFAYGGAISLMLALSPTLTLWSLLPLPLFVLATRWFSKQVFGRSRASQVALSQLSDSVQESVTGIRVARTLGAEKMVQKRFYEANEVALQQNMSLAVLRGVMFPTLSALTALGTLLVIWKGGEMILDGVISPGAFTAFVGYLAQLIWPTMAFGFLLSVVQRGRAAYGRVREMIDAPRDLVDVENPKPFPNSSGLQVRRLEYSFGAHRALEDVTFSVPSGTSLAIVGRTGAGKSTLVSLVAKLLPIEPGQVFWGDRDCTHISLEDFRRNVTLGQQEPVMFSSTIAANIAMGLEELDAPDAFGRIQQATRRAAIAEEIERMPDGLDTFVGERGVQLSGGQKQRVALARALCRNAPVLILDDPLSAVDGRTEQTILDAVFDETRDQTLIFVTNRMTMAARADRVVVLDKGRIVEQGSPAELEKGGGLYQELHERQQLEQELDTL